MHRKRLMMQPEKSRADRQSAKKEKSCFGEPPLQRTRSDGQAFKPTREPRVLPRPETDSLHIPVRAFAAFGNETVDPRRDNGQRYRAKLEHRIATHAS